MTYSLADLQELRRSLKLRIAAEIATGDLRMAAEALEEMKVLEARIADAMLAEVQQRRQTV